MILELKRDNETFATLELTKGCSEILTGRSHSCALRTPADDHSVSGKHARIFWKSGTAYIEDCGSKNGIYVNGRRIDRPVKLEDGGIYGIGSCRIVVSRRTKRSVAAQNKCHKLEFLNGDRAHDIVDIKSKSDSTGGLFTLGLDPGNDIVLPDMLVSRRHAGLLVKRDGACWIQDLGSRNGTYVNGEKLSGKERFLHDGDKISIAYFDFRFLHKDVSHTRAHLWTKLGVLAVLGIVITTGVVIREFVVKPPSKLYRSKARAAASAENFPAAFNALTNALSARNGKAERMQNDALSGELRAWSQTYAAWKRIKADLRSGKVASVRTRLFEALQEQSNWMWNDSTARRMREEAEITADLIRRIYNASDVMKSPDADIRERVIGGISDIDDYFSRMASTLASLPYLASATNNLMKFRAKMVVLRDGFSRIDGALSKIDKSSPDFSGAVRVLENVVRSTQLPEGVRSYASSLLPTCRKFTETDAFLEKEFAAVTDLDFAAVASMRNGMPIPDKNDAARLNIFSDMRNVYLKVHDSYQKEASLLAPMIRNIEEAGVTGGAPGGLIEFVTLRSSWDKALSFDCFAGRFPEPSRLDPNSVYDELCGIECTYENLRNLPKAPTRQTSVRMKFIPKAQKAKVVFDQIKTFVAVLDRPEGRMFQTGKLGMLYALAVKIQEMREQLVKELKLRCESGLPKGARLSRERIIAGFFAEYFSDEPSYADLRALETSFKALERHMNALNERYDAESDPEKRLAIRGEILKKGIPGGESVRKRWVETME